MRVKFSDLYPLHTKYADLYADPTKYGCREGSRIVSGEDMPEEGSVLYLGTVVEKSVRDMNEIFYLQKRNGRRVNGQTMFVDLTCNDDSGTPIRCRIDRHSYHRVGAPAMEKLVTGQDVVLVRGRRVPNYQMINVDRIRCLTRPEILDA
jgi:hypothetical protein